ncbi:hypothetical protein J2Y60_005041 [Arcicella sp. BE140]|nr:hypothetical protein [Arcicella sp. BE139]MDR6564998.1 hypothetical protein [Arcicella sp. BE51]MDR6814823.1 hypothetical protein [Arcicella sp. BE140]MDR6826269.1 hypothetical protein [Arcicella sp. BE139]
MMVLIPSYLLLNSIYYYIFCKDFIIEKDKIVLLSAKAENYDFDNIVKIVFVEKSSLVYISQKIEIFFSDGSKKIINCDGLNSDDEYIDSFYNKYEHIKNVFEKTYLQESFLSPLIHHSVH